MAVGFNGNPDLIYSKNPDIKQLGKPGILDVNTPKLPQEKSFFGKQIDPNILAKRAPTLSEKDEHKISLLLDNPFTNHFDRNKIIIADSPTIPKGLESRSTEEDIGHPIKQPKYPKRSADEVEHA